MAEELYYDKINRHVDWGGDESTNNLPVAGSAVQEFIKSELNGKIGVVYMDEVSAQYLCFANEEDRDIYLADRSNEHLILSAFIAPSQYKAKIKVDSYYRAVLLNSINNELTFNYEITNNDEVFVDNVRYVISITKNGKTSTINGVGVYGKQISVNLDEYMKLEGTTEVSINITGQTTNATASVVVTYDVVNLEFESDYDVSTVYDLSKGDTGLKIRYSIFGTNNIKYIDWYVDDEFLNTDTILGGTVEPLPDVKEISLYGFSHGVHNVKFRAYVVVNGENFYTDTLYKEFIVIADKNNTSPLVAIETTIPKNIEVAAPVKLYDVVQYESYSLHYGVYNPKNLEYIEVDIYLDDVKSSTVNAPNNKELIYNFTAGESGNKIIKFKIGNYEKVISADIASTSMNLQELDNNLILSLSASGKTNNDVDREIWSYGLYQTFFEGFNWSSAYGWNDNRLVIGDGMKITTNIEPLKSTTYGKTIEIEFETFNVTNDDAIICNLQNSHGLGLLITATKAMLKVGFGDRDNVATNYKANENVRISFVINSISKLAVVYVNGIMSGAVAINNELSIEKELSFIGTSEAGIKLKQIRIYDTQLTAEQILNNYILYRDTINDIKSLYTRNDILDGSFISIEKVSDHIPVILLTGEEIYDLEADKDTDREIKIDVEYINKQDPTHQFKFYGGCCRIQGTSSAGYVRKNWRIYSKRKEKFVADVYDWKGVPVTDSKRRIAFKEGAVPVNCWTLKADFAESSGTHNTGVATLWNDVMYNAYHTTNGFVCRTNAQKAALENGYEHDCRTTVDGFPIVVFARRNDKEEYTFMGKYNFNNDKSTENVFGFCDIPGFDDAYIPGHEDEMIPEGEMNAGKPYTYGNKMQCWEIRENEDSYALFRTTKGWYDPQINADGSIKVDEDNVVVKSWASGFEARYPDDGNEADISDLKAFADWMTTCTQEQFATEKYDHFDMWKIAAYYVYLMRFGAVDQVVKNSMFTSEDGKHWYFINYDNDTILGLDNSGNNIYLPTITRQTPHGATYAYAGHESRMWNMLEADTEFMTYYVPEVDNVLANGGLSYNTALKYFNTNQSDKWCERIYNEDANYKYVKPYTAGTVNELVKMHGSRKSHRTWWLSKRFQLMDAKFSNVNYRGKHIHMKLHGAEGAEFTIKAADYMYFGCEYNKNAWAMGVELNKSESYTFYKASSAEDPVNGKDFVMGDPIYIYSPLYIEELDLSKISSYIYVLEFGDIVNETTSPMMKKLIIGGNKSAITLSSLSGLNVLTNLEYLDLTGINYTSLDIENLLQLKTLILTDSKFNTIKLATGCMIEDLYLSDAVRTINLNSLPSLTIDRIHDFDKYHVNNISIDNSPKLTNNFGFYYHWIKNGGNGDSLHLSGLNWDDISPANLIEFGDFVKRGGKLDLHGKITIKVNLTSEEVEKIQSIFGEYCFVNGGDLWISAPDSVFIHGPKEVRSGDSQIYTTTIFSENPGEVEWQIEEGSEFVKSIVSNPDNTGIITTIEDETADHRIVIKAIHKPSVTTDESYYKVSTYEIISRKAIYATDGFISGNATIKKDEVFTLNLGPANYNGDYTAKWILTGESFNNGSIVLANTNNVSCTIKYLKEVIFDLCTLTAIVSNKNGSVLTINLTITVTDNSVLMTSTSNPEVISICYNQGWCASPDVMYKTEAQVVTDIGTAFKNSNIKSFDEFEEFKNLRSIPTEAFIGCRNMTSIKIPSGIERLERFCLGSTGLTSILIPNNVSYISEYAFDTTGIVNFEVGAANATFFARDGILFNYDGTLIKYPEGKTDEYYVVDDSVTGLYANAFSGTKLKSLTIGDKVSKHNNNSISSNKYLESLHLGASINPTYLADHIYGNDLLLNITVSEAHLSLCSVDGVVYNIDKTVLWKYPEGRTEFNIVPTVKTIGTLAAQRSKIKTIEIPASVEIIENQGFYAINPLTKVTFADGCKLSSIGSRSFQLASNCTEMSFPETLTKIGSVAFSSCDRLSILKFHSKTAPIFTDGYTPTDIFGGDSSTFTGRLASNRVLYVPSDSTGYEDTKWTESILSPERNNFTLSKTL